MLEQLETTINTEITASGGTPDSLADGLARAFSEYLGQKIWPLMIGIAITVTILFIFYGAFLYFTAYGDENKATQAKKTITSAFVGLFIVGMAFGIASFVNDILITKKAKDTISAPTGAAPANGPANPLNKRY